jgi:hypothetical protein
MIRPNDLSEDSTSVLWWTSAISGVGNLAASAGVCNELIVRCIIPDFPFVIAYSPKIISNLDSKIRVDLQGLDFSLFSWVAASTILVAIGCAMEGPELLHEFWPTVFPCLAGRWVKRLGLIGWFFVVLGVAGEGVVEIYDHHASGLLQTFDEVLLTDTQRQTADAYERAAYAQEEADSFQDQIADANARAKGSEAKVALAESESKTAAAKVATADARIAEAERGAAEANKATEAERLARLRIQATMEDRYIDGEQQLALKAGLCPKFWGRVYVGTLVQTPEAFRLADGLTHVFESCGVVRSDPMAGGPYGGLADGIVIVVGKDKESNDFAGTVVNALRGQGLEAAIASNKSLPFEKSILVIVGGKPQLRPSR